MDTDYNQILTESQDVTTHPTRLDEIYSSLQDNFPRNQKSQIVEAIALNPNTSPDTLKHIFQRVEGMANKIINHNPSIPLLQLENRKLLQEWISEKSSKIFRYPISLDLQRTALATKDTMVYLNLAESKHVAKEIIEAIANNIDVKASNREDYWLKQALVKNQHTPIAILIKLLEMESQWKLHEDIWNNINQNPDKKQAAVNYFQSLNTKEQRWAENIVPIIENILRDAKTKDSIYQGYYGFQSLKIGNYKIEILPEAGIKILYRGTHLYSKRQVFSYDIESLQVYISIPTQSDMKLWHKDKDMSEIMSVLMSEKDEDEDEHEEE